MEYDSNGEIQVACVFRSFCIFNLVDIYINRSKFKKNLYVIVCTDNFYGAVFALEFAPVYKHLSALN